MHLDADYRAPWSGAEGSGHWLELCLEGDLIIGTIDCMLDYAES